MIPILTKKIIIVKNSQNTMPLSWHNTVYKIIKAKNNKGKTSLFYIINMASPKLKNLYPCSTASLYAAKTFCCPAKALININKVDFGK